MRRLRVLLPPTVVEVLRSISTSPSPSSSVSVSGRDVSVEWVGDGGDARRERYLGSVAVDWVAVEGLVAGVGAGSHTGLAMMVPLRSRLGMTTDPVGVPEPTGVAAADTSVDISVSLPEVASVDADSRSKVSCEPLL